MSRVACVLAASLLFTPLGHAEGEAAAADPMRDCNSGAEKMEIPRPGWLLTWENDSKIGPYGTDEFYTQGMQLGYRMRPDRQPQFLSQVMGAICRSIASSPEDGKLVGAGSVFFGQHFFTPGNIEVSALIPDDRPYAAWLYVGTRLEVAQRFDTPRRFIPAGLFHTFEFQFGTLGPRAQGEWVQTRWHEISDAPPPLGWDNQLPNEWGVQLRYTVRGMVKDLPVQLGRWHGWQLQGTVDGDFNLGTVLDTASVGTTWRFGRNLGDPVATRLQPALEPFGADSKASEKAASSWVDSNFQRTAAADATRPYCWHRFRLFECYVFAGITGHAVGFSAFLDGEMFNDGHSVNKEPFVYDYTAGLRLGWKLLQLDYTATWSSREFSPVPETADRKSGKHAFGAINLRCFAPINGETRSLDFVCPTVFGILLAAVALQ